MNNILWNQIIENCNLNLFRVNNIDVVILINKMNNNIILIRVIKTMLIILKTAQYIPTYNVMLQNKHNIK